MKRKTAKEILAESFRELADKKNIDKITIREITDNCGYSPATFYRQFKDKYDLIAWAYAGDLEKIVDRMEYDANSWKQTLVDAANYYEEHRAYLSNLLIHTSGYDSFVNNMTEIHFNSLKTRILKAAKLKELDEKTEMYIRIYVHGSVQLTCEWIRGLYAAGTDDLVDVYDQSLPMPLRKYLCEK